MSTRGSHEQRSEKTAAGCWLPLATGWKYHLEPAGDKCQVWGLSMPCSSLRIDWLDKNGRPYSMTETQAGRSQFAQGTAVFLRAYVCTFVDACKFKGLTSKNCQNITTVRKLSVLCQVTAAGDDCVKISSRWGRRTTTCIWHLKMLQTALSKCVFLFYYYLYC